MQASYRDENIYLEETINQQQLLFESKQRELIEQNTKLQLELKNVNNVPKALALMTKKNSTKEQIESGYVREMCDILGQNEDING